MDWWIIDRLFIAEHLSVRHWIAESGQRWQQVLYVYICICPSYFWNAIKFLCDVIAENLQTSGNLSPDFDRCPKEALVVSKVP